MRVLKLLVPAGIVMTGLLLCTSLSYGTAEYAKKEKKACATCHIKMGAPEAMKKEPNLSDYGKCYKDNNHTADKCKAPEKK